MQALHSALTRLPDRDLLAEVKRLSACERRATADLIASLAELDSRRLYLGEGYSSLFTYCTKALGLSEDAAYFRIEAARAARRFPAILERLAEGAVTLTAVRLLAPHLTPENHVGLLDAARGRSKREIELLLAGLHPQPDVPLIVRKLPAPVPRPSASSLSSLPAQLDECAAGDRVRPSTADERPSSMPSEREVPQAAILDAGAAGLASSPPAHARSRHAVMSPLAPERYKVQMTVSAETHDRLRRAQELLRYVIPDGDAAAIFDRALVVLIEQLERSRFAAKKPRIARTRSADEAVRSHHPTPGATGRALPPVANKSCDAGRGAARQLVPERVDSKVIQQTRDERKRPEASVKHGAPKSSACRHIPAVVKRVVWERDGGQCTFVGSETRCRERNFLEYHHVVPYADGGQATAENIQLRCRSHNHFEAHRWNGPGLS